jgi:hypothetical protein
MNMSSKIKPLNFFVIINNKINSSSRILLTGMLLSLLWFIIYYNAREYFFHPLYFVMPSLLIILILIVLPKLASKGNNNANNILEGIDTSNMQIEQVQLSSQESLQSQEQPVTASNSNQVAIDESLIQQLIDEKINSIALEFNESKQKVNDALTTVNNIKTDIENLKKSIKELTEAFETTLVDFKAFQAEIANPLNFMRKYFDQLDIKNLSDPTLPLQQSDINTSNNNGYNNGNDEYSNGNSNGKALSKDNALDDIKNNHDDGKGNNSKNNNENKDSPIKDIITLAESNGITLSKLMELILTIGDFMRVFGNEYAKILDVQCKLLNLSKDAEKIVYSIVDMLSKSTLTAEECVISLYKLASVLGFNDSNADTIYARVKMSIKSEHHNGRRLDDGRSLS